MFNNQRKKKMLPLLFAAVVMMLMTLLPTEAFAAKQFNGTETLVTYDNLIDPYEKKEFSFYLPCDTEVTLWASIYLWGEYDDFNAQDTTCNFRIYNNKKEYFSISEDNWIEKNIKLEAGYYTLSVEKQTKCYAELNFTLSYDTYIDVPSYKELTQKAKSLATKNIKYKNIDVGNHARLTGVTHNAVTKVNYDDLAFGTNKATLFIDVKKDASYSVRLAISGTTHRYSVFMENYLYFDKVKFYSSNRSVSFDLGGATNYRKYSYKNSLYNTYSTWWATISSDVNNRSDKLDKLIKILNQKTVKVKVYDSYGSGYFWTTLDDSTRKNWLAVCKKYRTLLNMF